MKRHACSGSIVVEEVLILPLALGAVIAVLVLAALYVRGFVAQHALFRVSRAVASFDPASVAHEWGVSLPSLLFQGGGLEVQDPTGALQVSNEEEGIVIGKVRSSALVAHPAGAFLWRNTSVIPVLPRGLSSRQLQEGDAPSIYCRMPERGYALCTAVE